MQIIHVSHSDHSNSLGSPAQEDLHIYLIILSIYFALLNRVSEEISDAWSRNGETNHQGQTYDTMEDTTNSRFESVSAVHPLMFMLSLHTLNVLRTSWSDLVQDWRVYYNWCLDFLREHNGVTQYCPGRLVVNEQRT